MIWLGDFFFSLVDFHLANELLVVHFSRSYLPLSACLLSFGAWIFIGKKHANIEQGLHTYSTERATPLDRKGDG